MNSSFSVKNTHQCILNPMLSWFSKLLRNPKPLCHSIIGKRHEIALAILSVTMGKVGRYKIVQPRFNLLIIFERTVLFFNCGNTYIRSLASKNVARFNFPKVQSQINTRMLMCSFCPRLTAPLIFVRFTSNVLCTFTYCAANVQEVSGKSEKD